jgi:hypothetical protein
MKIEIVLESNNLTNAEIVVDGDNYITNMTGKDVFDTPEVTAQLTATTNAVAGLRSAMRAPSSDDKTDNIRMARDIVDRNLKKLANRVEDIANDPSVPDAARIDIAHQAGMKVKTRAPRQKNQFKAVNGNISGSVILTAASGANAHLWEYTTDIEKFTGRILAKKSTSGTVVLTGFTPLTKCAFFHQPIIGDDDTEWEGPIILDIH